MKQFRTLIISAISIFGAFLAACGSDSGTDSGTAQAETIYGLGECDASNEGVVKLVTSEDQYYKCEDGDWEVTEAPVQSSSSENSQFARSSSSTKAFPGLDTKSSASSGIFSTDSKSGNDTVEQMLIDERDGQTYRTVKIGNQTWMAENLNYRYLGPTDTLDSSSFCYDDDPANCAKYGRLYLWSAAMDSAGIIKGNAANGCGIKSECTSIEPVRGVCPQGWHLPSESEWEALVVAVDGSITQYTLPNTAATKLRSTSGWNNDGNGTDDFGFSALPAGYRDYGGGYNYEGNVASFFWSSTEYPRYDDAYSMNFSYNDEAGLNYCNKYNGFSVRCLKD